MELEDLKIRYNLLNEEKAELQSQLNVQCKLRAENKKVVEKYKELKMVCRVRMFFDSTVCTYVGEF